MAYMRKNGRSEASEIYDVSCERAESLIDRAVKCAQRKVITPESVDKNEREIRELNINLLVVAIPKMIDKAAIERAQRTIAHLQQLNDSAPNLA